MRRLRIALILALAVTSCLYGWIQFQEYFSGQKYGPTLTCPQEVLEISVFQDRQVLLTGVQAEDPQDGDLTQQVMLAGISKLISDDTAKVTYIVFDSDDNMATAERMVRYLDYHRPRIYADEPLSYSSVASTSMGKGLRAVDSIDGDITSQVRVSTLNTTEESDVYQIVAQVTNSMGDNFRLELPVIIQSDDLDQPVIHLKDYVVYLDRGASFSPRDMIILVSAYRKTFPASEVEIECDVDTNQPGTYWVKYSLVQNGKISKAILTVVVQ